MNVQDLSVVVVAGGRGSRFGGSVPKQFLLLNGRPVLMHSVEVFACAREIVVVLPADQIDVWQSLCVQYDFRVAHRVVAGGAERTDSVRAGLAAIAANDGLVAIHDGVRPWVSADLVDRVAAEARRSQAAIPVVAVTDTVRQITSPDHSKTLDRTTLRAVQTPQIFSLSLLRACYSTGEVSGVTDDASVVEAAGHNVVLVEGAPANKKITTRQDL